MCSCLSAVIRGLLSQRAPERHSGSQLTFCQGVRRDRQRFVGEVEVEGGGWRCRANGEDKIRPQCRVPAATDAGSDGRDLGVTVREPPRGSEMPLGTTTRIYPVAADPPYTCSTPA